MDCPNQVLDDGFSAQRLLCSFGTLWCTYSIFILSWSMLCKNKQGWARLVEPTDAEAKFLETRTPRSFACSKSLEMTAFGTLVCAKTWKSKHFWALHKILEIEAFRALPYTRRREITAFLSACGFHTQKSKKLQHSEPLHAWNLQCLSPCIHKIRTDNILTPPCTNP